MNIYMMVVVYFLFELGENTRFIAEAVEGAKKRYKLTTQRKHYTTPDGFRFVNLNP